MTMTFLHWPFDPADIQALLPEPMVVDTFDGAAWVSMTLFRMTDFRLGRLPSIPGLSTFPETNLRTYARGPDGRDGLWFFSLEAASLPLVAGAWTLYGIPYRWAGMAVEVGDTIRYRSRRRSRRPAGYDVTVRVGGPCPDDAVLANWLTGRWRAYTRPAGRLCAVPAEHPPWPLYEAAVVDLQETLLAAAGVPRPGTAPLAQYSPGVDVRLGLLRPV